MHRNMRPVIEPRPAHRRFVDPETQRVNQVQGRPGTGTKPGNGTGILRNDRLVEDQIEVARGHAPLLTRNKALRNRGNPTTIAPMRKTVHIKTFGCQMNVYDSDRMLAVLEQNGYVSQPDPREAGVILINTCAI